MRGTTVGPNRSLLFQGQHRAKVFLQVSQQCLLLLTGLDVVASECLFCGKMISTRAVSRPLQGTP